MKQRLFVAFVVPLLSVCACATTPEARSGRSGGCPDALSLVVSHGARGVVLPSNVARRDLSLRRTDVEDYWVPSEDDIAELESSLKDAIKTRLTEANQQPPSADRDAEVSALTQIQAHLGEYVRQYAGIVVNGNRRVLLNAFPEDTYCYRDQLVVIRDGGPWFWTIQYDVKLHQFLHWELASKAYSA
jgi:hypothetical protein